MRLGELLVEGGHVAEADVQAALALQGQQGLKLGAALVRLGALSQATLTEVLSVQLQLPLQSESELDEARLRDTLTQLPPSATWWLEQGLLLWEEDGRRIVACEDPLRPDLREAVEALPGSTEWRLMQAAAVEHWVERLRHAQDPAGADAARSLRELAEDAPVVAYVSNLLAQALEARASDIHVEPGERECSIRLRIDGVMHERPALDMGRYPAVASRIKLIGGLDIAERRLPQDGRISTRVAGREIDIRISSIPAVYGESLVLRLLPKARGDVGLHRIGMQADHRRLFEQWLQWPNGLVLVTGPTGSGKSTSLYGALSAINDGERKLITVEDPVELRLPGVVQIQTQAEIGYTFARALRAILRHDPDVIMVGEIRDRETAEIAIQAALTGHLVLATLHTNDALSAVNRLVDMGVEPYLVAASLRAVMAQRLVRRLCPDCRQPQDPDPTLLQRWQRLRSRLAFELQPQWYRAQGCARCGGTGFLGREGIYELVPMSLDMQHAIAQQVGSESLLQMANAAGRRSLVEDGLLKVAQGLSTFDEVLRAASAAEEM